MSLKFHWIRMGILMITFRIPLDLQGNPQDFLQNFLILVQLRSTAAQRHSSTAEQRHSSTAAQAAHSGTAAQAPQQHLKLRGFPLESH